MTPSFVSQTVYRAIGVDIGGTKIAAGVVEFPGGEVRARRTFPTRPERGGEAVRVEVEEVVSDLAGGDRDGVRRVQGIGVGICEIVNLSGDVASASSLHLDAALMRQRLSAVAPTILEADVRAAALAEALFGAGRQEKVFLYVSIGTGIASCLVLDGQPFAGSRGASGTLASGPLPTFEEGLPSFPSRSVEQLAAGPALVARFRALGGVAQSAQDVVSLATAGNPDALRVVQSGAAVLGATIGTLVNVLDPGRVILGGGLGLRDGLYRDALIRAARAHIWWPHHRDLPILPATTAADAGVIGAAAAAWKRVSQ